MKIFFMLVAFVTAVFSTAFAQGTFIFQNDLDSQVQLSWFFVNSPGVTNVESIASVNAGSSYSVNTYQYFPGPDGGGLMVVDPTLNVGVDIPGTQISFLVGTTVDASTTFTVPEPSTGSFFFPTNNPDSVYQILQDYWPLALSWVVGALAVLAIIGWIIRAIRNPGQPEDTKEYRAYERWHKRHGR